MIVEGAAAPDRNDEYLLYQTLVGAWPPDPSGSEGFARFRERILAYMRKAVKEAKLHTSWISPNEDYDKALARFIERLLDDSRRNPSLADLGAFARRVAWFGRFIPSASCCCAWPRRACRTFTRAPSCGT